MDKIKNLDSVAYVRFASVYREFKDVNTFMSELKKMLDKWDNGELDFTPTCPRNTYNNQFEYMVNYMTVLADRASMEGIEL